MKESNFSLDGKFKDAHLSKIQFNEQNSEKLLNWVNTPKNFLVLMGIPGVGKTYFCAALKNHRNDEKKFSFFLREKDFFSGLRESISEMGTSPDWELHKIAEMPFLIFDDLGVGGTESTNKDDYTAFQIGHLFDLIDSRWENSLPTIFTTNILQKDMKRTFTPRMVDRLMDIKNVKLEIIEPSWRQIER